jgi:hypothetical protein
MTTDIETIIHCEQGVRVSVSDYDQGVWLHLSMRHGTSCAVLNRKEAELLFAGLQAILEKETA